MTSFPRFLVRFAIASVLVIAVTSVGVVAGNSLFEREYNDTPIVDIPSYVFAPEEKGEPANFLIVGSDTRAIVESEEEAAAFGDTGGERSDTLMVVHVDPDTETGFVVSFPRDLWVDIPGHGASRINAAFGLGGPELVIQTLRENYGIDIHHYLEVDFDGFREIVDVLGGVDILFNTPARDTKSGLDIPEAGCRELDGDQALAYARSRYYEAYDAERDRGATTPRSDLSRIERQQYFIRSLADEALDEASGNLVTAYRLVTEVFDHLKRDPGLELSDLKGLLNAFRDLDPTTVEMYTVPTVADTIGDAEVQVLVEDEAAPLLARLNSFGVPTAELPELAVPATVTVDVLNGTSSRGEADSVIDALVAHGYVASGGGDADRDDYQATQVRYTPGAVGEGLTVGLALGTPDVLETRAPLPPGIDVQVIVGDDWDDLPAPVKTAPTPTTAPSSTAPTDSAVPAAPPTSELATTTSTTVAVSSAATLFVPVDPETGGPLVGCP